MHFFPRCTLSLLTFDLFFFDRTKLLYRLILSLQQQKQDLRTADTGRRTTESNKTQISSI